MIEILRRVRGAVSKQIIVPAMSHFFIYQGRIQGTNGRIAIDCPIPELDGYSLTVPAEKFIKAIDSCSDDPKIEVTQSQVIITDGSFKVRLPILANDAFPRSSPQKASYDLPTKEGLTDALKTLLPFVSTDASKPWSTGVYLGDDGYAYATNNVIMVKIKSPLKMPKGEFINLPAYAVEELLSFNEQPVSFGLREDRGEITFHFPSGAWLSCLTLLDQWPIAQVKNLFNGFPKDLPEVPEGLQKGIERVLPFCPNEKFPVIVLSDDRVSTDEGGQSAEIEGFAFDGISKFNGVMLGLVMNEATYFEPAGDEPSRFKGKNGLQGIIAGVI